MTERNEEYAAVGLYQPRHMLRIGAKVGEAPMWSQREMALFWVDVHGSTFNRFNPASGGNVSWQLPSIPGCFALTESGAIIAAKDGFYEFDSGSEKLTLAFDSPFDKTQFRFNDGKPDRQGRLCVGSVALKLEDRAGAVPGTIYVVSGDQVSSLISPISFANGIAFSPDGTIMYRAESLQRRILRYDYNYETAEASNEALFALVPEFLGFPDGATTDTEGGYWIALALGEQGGGVARYTSDGDLDIYIRMPVHLPTMVAFGGEDMTTLFVTSASAPPGNSSNRFLGDQAGDIFAIDTEFCGIPEAMFRRF